MAPALGSKHPYPSSSRLRLGPALVVAALAGSACATAATEARAPVAQNSYGDAAALVKQSLPSGMSLARIEHYLQIRANNLKAPRPGVWHLSVDGVLVLMIAEDSRLRILAPIFAMHQLDSDPAIQSALMVRLLQANFDKSADARYAIFDGIVFAAITHPRATLREEDLDLFLKQVVNLHKNTFRTGMRGYSSATPEADSVEIDPRTDDSLREPDAFEKHEGSDDASAQPKRDGARHYSGPDKDKKLLL